MIIGANNTTKTEYEDGYEATKQLLSIVPDITSIFAFNDMMAIGCLSYLQSIGYNVPEDIALIGCDNISQSQFTSPPLSTINIPKELLGELTCEILINEINNIPYNIPTVESELILRSST